MANFDGLYTGIKLLMLIEQKLAGNEVNPDVFRKNSYAVTSVGGFNWDTTVEGDDIWGPRIESGKYDLGLCLCNIRSLNSTDAAVIFSKPHNYEQFVLPKSALESIDITKYANDLNLRPLVYYEQKSRPVSPLKFACNLVDTANRDLTYSLLNEFYTFCHNLDDYLDYDEKIRNKFNELFKNGKDQNQLQGEEVHREHRESGSGIRLQSDKLRLTSVYLEYRGGYQGTGTELRYRRDDLSFKPGHMY